MSTMKALLSVMLIAACTAPLQAQPSSRNADEFKPKKQESTGTKVGLDSFMEAVADCDATGLRSQLHPDLAKKVDGPVLQFLLDEIQKTLGKPHDDERQESTETKKIDGHLTMTTKATIPFDEGTAEIHLSRRENSITSFEIKSPKLEKLDEKLGSRLLSDAKLAKTTGEYYVNRTELLAYLILKGEDREAHEMLHPEIQQQFPIEKAKEVFAAIRTEHGRLKDIQYTGLTVNTDETDKFKNVSINFDLVCEKNNAKAVVNIQFVGLAGAITGVNFYNKEEDTVPPPIEKSNKIAAKTYRHDKDALSEKHVAKFVQFQFDYPAGWEVDKSAGTEESPNSVKVYRNIDLGEDGTYTQENFAIGSCQVDGAGELAKIQLQFLSEQLRGQIEKGFPEFNLRREGEMKFGKYYGYGFEFSSKIPHPKKEKVDCWGRVILLAPSAIGQEHGLSIIMLATSEASELKSLDDLGVKGELPVLIKSFHIGKADSKKKSKEPDSDPIPPPPIPAPPMP